MQLRWIAEADVEPSRALATGAALLESVAEADSPAAILYGAGLVGDALAIGRWEHAARAVSPEAVADGRIELLRRSTGGPLAALGKGIVYVALCLRHASAFMSCPPDRVLNRNVRGVLGGLTLAGAPAHYFGREWLSVARRPAVLVGWSRLPDGRVLLEFFLSHTRLFVPDPALVGYPERDEEPFLGKPPVTLDEVWEEHPGVEQIVRWIAEGHPSRFGSEMGLSQSSLTDDERRRARADAARFVWTPDGDGEAALRWSRPHEIPIGWLEAGVRLDDEGLIADVRVAGDFYQDEEAPEVLRAKLLGQRPDASLYADAVNTTWDNATRFIEGVRDMGSVLAALLEAAPAR